MNEEYSRMSDEELVSRYHKGEHEAADFLVEKYKNLVRKGTRAFYLEGADPEDLLQEGMIGLYKAIRDYDTSHQTVFMTFASLCINRQIRTAVTTANRQKYRLLNDAVSLDATTYDDEGNDVCLAQVLPSEERNNPEDLYIEQEQNRFILNTVYDSLSKLEKQVLELYMEGMGYIEISQAIGRSPKSIDNTIQRIRAKVGKAMRK